MMKEKRGDNFLWSATTCRRFGIGQGRRSGPGAAQDSRKAATSRRTPYIALAAAMVLAGCSAFAFVPRNRERTTASAATEAAPKPATVKAPAKPATAQQIDGQILPDPKVLHTERIWIYGDRIYPDVIYLRPGPVRLQVE